MFENTMTKRIWFDLLVFHFNNTIIQIHLQEIFRENLRNRVQFSFPCVLNINCEKDDRENCYHFGLIQTGIQNHFSVKPK